MEYKQTYTKEEAIKNADAFLAEVRKLEEKYSISFNSDRGDIYLSFRKNYTGSDQWGSVKIGWDGDGTGLKVKEETKEQRLKRIWDTATASLSEEDKKALGLMINKKD